MLELVIPILFGIICAFACRAIAQGKNRRPGFWFVFGLLFGLVAVIVLACLPALPV